jgi:hypothetical protein
VLAAVRSASYDAKRFLASSSGLRPRVIVEALDDSAARPAGHLQGVPNRLWPVGGRERPIGVMVALSLPVAFVVTIAGLLLLRGRRGVRRQAVAAAAACSLAAALLVSTPVAVGWDDGCNAHGALVPLAASPAVLTSPEAFPLAYVDIQTLMLCDRQLEIN